MNRRVKCECIILECTLCLAPVARGVIVAGGDGSQNTTAPEGGRGWDYVGRITSANGAPSSVTYLRNNWFVTAYHVKQYDNPTGVILGGSSYSIDANSWTRITNSSGSAVNTDLILFQVEEDVGLPDITIASTPANGTELTMIGNGRNRAPDLTQWLVSGSTWKEVDSGGNHFGYKWASGATKHWGVNTKASNDRLRSDGFGLTDMFRTDFDDEAGQAQAATYDSGGGVFVKNGDEWQLAGIMLAVSTYSGQPAGTSVFGESTYIADLSVYSNEITGVQAVPEPSVLFLAAITCGGGVFIRRFFLI